MISKYSFYTQIVISLISIYVYAPRKSAAMHIERIYRNIPAQLMKEIDGSVRRYQFSKVIPAEVKSGKRTQAKSLKTYIDRFHPKCAYKFTANIVGFREASLRTLPLYYAAYYINKLIHEESDKISVVI